VFLCHHEGAHETNQSIVYLLIQTVKTYAHAERCLLHLMIYNVAVGGHFELWGVAELAVMMMMKLPILTCAEKTRSLVSLLIGT